MCARAGVCVCVFLCLCLRERERVAGRGNLLFYYYIFQCLIIMKSPICSLCLHCVTIDYSERNDGTQCYHRGDLKRRETGH